MSVELIHYSAAPLVLDRGRQYHHHSAWDKPGGLWCSIGTAWADWIATEMPEHRRKRWAVGTLIEVTAPDELLWLTSWDDLLAVSREFAAGRRRWWRIEWNVIASRYAGVVLTLDPHEWNAEVVELLIRGRTAVPTWVLGWDVPSACIWDMEVIA